MKKAVAFISAFEEAVARDAERHEVQGVMCGHIHQPTIRRLGDIEYFNTGDWIESCSAIIETADGAFELIHWKPDQPTLSNQARPYVAPALVDTNA